MSTHLTDDQLIARIYGVSEDEEHIAECAECASRLERFERRRAELARPAEASAEFLAAQRRAVYARMDGGSRRLWKWIPAAAAAFVIAVGLLVYRPAAPAPAPTPDAADAQLFSEMYSMAQSTEPRAAAPIHGLFEANQ